MNLQEENASVTFDEQASDGEQVVVESATLPEGGFVAIHDGSYTEAPVASVLGSSVYLEPGTHENVTITLARPVAESQTLVAMPHLDTNENQVFDYVLSTGEIDGPYTADGEAVVDEANVTVEQETTTTTEAEDETTTEDAVQDTTTGTEAPGDAQQFIFQVEQMNIDEWSFVVGDEQEPDRTQTVGNVSITDRRVNINLSELLRQSAAAQQAAGPVTTVSPERAEEILQENLTQDIQTVRYVVSNVTVENVTFVVTAPEDVELPQPPMTTQDVVEETTTTEEEDVIDETTTTTEEDVIDETTTEEEAVEETTTTTEEEEVVEETTTEEEEVEENTTTTEEAEPAALDSFTISNLDAPSSATTNDTITVSATVSNPNDQQATQPVTFRLEGTVVARQSVTLDAGEQTTVSFEVDTSGVPAGQYIHGVYTRDFGELAVLVVEEPTEATTTAAEQTDGETTVAADETTTTTATDETTIATDETTIATDETTTATA